MVIASVRTIVLSATLSALFVTTMFAQSNSQTNGSTPNNTPATGSQGGISQFSNIQDRVQSRDRNAPYRESGQAIKIAKHFNAIFAGLAHGAGMAFGAEATTADIIPAVEFRARAIVSTRLYR
jgi:hypothetical protein